MADEKEHAIDIGEMVKAAEEANVTDDGASEEQEHHHRHHHHHHHHHGKRRRRHRSKRKKRIKRIVIVVIVILLTAAAIIAGIFYTMYHSGRRELVSSEVNIAAPENVISRDNGKYITYNGEKYQYNSDIISILILGIDKYNSASADKQIGDNHQSDLIALCTIDKKNGKISLINIPRDIMTDVNVYSPAGGYVGREKMQIAMAYAYGDGGKTSCVNAAESVSRLFYNVPMQTYFSLNLDGVAELNDSIGGVDVTSPETIGQFTKGEKYHLEGEDARDFVNLRVMDRADANLLRNERQKVYVNAYLKKLISQIKKDVSTAVDVFNVSAPYSCTNLNSDRITYLATEFVVNRNMDLTFENVPVDVKQAGDTAENYVKEKEFYELFLSIFYNKV